MADVSRSRSEAEKMNQSSQERVRNRFRGRTRRVSEQEPQRERTEQELQQNANSEAENTDESIETFNINNNGISSTRSTNVGIHKAFNKEGRGGDQARTARNHNISGNIIHGEDGDWVGIHYCGNDTREEGEEGQNSLGALHKYNFFLLGMLGLLLQLKSGNTASPFVRNYVTVITFTVDLFVYVASLATVKKLDHQAAINDPDLSEFMDNVSLLSGTLASVLLLLILIPALGWLSLLLWAIYFVKDVVTVTSYTSVAVRAWDKVKEVMMNQSCFSISTEKQNHVHQQGNRMEEGQNHVP